MAPGRTSIPTPDIRRSAAPRARVREGGNRVPSIAWVPGKIKAGTKNSRDRRRPRSTWRRSPPLAGVKLPDNDREGKPIIFDSYDMSPVLFGTGKSPRNSWFYFTENELTPGAARVGNYKAVFNLRGDDGAADRRPRSRLQPRLEGRGELCRDGARRSSICGRTRRSATTSS